MTYRPTLKMAAGALAGLLTSSAWAHTGHGAASHSHDMLNSLMAGLSHPLTGADHLAAMVAVGMWSVLSTSQNTQQTKGRRGAIAMPLAFALTLAVGALIGMAGFSIGAAVEPMIAASLLVLGLLVATRQQLPAWLGTSMVAGFALFHGFAHGTEMTGHAVASLSGMLISTMALHLTGMAIGQWSQDQGHTIKRGLTRLAGFGIAAGGSALLAPAMANVF